MSGDVVRTGLVIERLDRLNTSSNGNPRFRVRFTDGTVADTKTDTSIAYSLPNPEFRDVPLTVTFTRAGRIWDIQRASPIGVEARCRSCGEAFTPTGEESSVEHPEHAARADGTPCGGVGDLAGEWV